MKNKLLYISDQNELSNHSFIENVINGYLKEYLDTYTVYFSKNQNHEIIDNRIILPNNAKNNPIKYLQEKKYVEVNEFSYIIVRNNYKALAHAIRISRKTNIKIGFQLSFPHSYRRVCQASQEQKSLLRKKLAYCIASRIETSLIEKCDIFFPISISMKNTFFPNIKVKTHPLSLGIDPDNIKRKPDNIGKIKFIYIGTVDKLRKLDVVFNALSSIQEDFELLVFTKESNYAKSLLKAPDLRIIIKDFIPREELFQEISRSDVGIFLLPVDDLYRVASPTKVMEYYSCSVPALMSKIDECIELFENRNVGWLCDFDELSLKKTFEEIFKHSRDQIRKMGEEGQRILVEKRNYRIMAQELYNSLNSLAHKSHTPLN